MITLLDEWTIKKIKAAQIINNYYDIVKELVENSIDSNSQNIQIDFNIKKQVSVIELIKCHLLHSISTHNVTVRAIFSIQSKV